MLSVTPKNHKESFVQVSNFITLPILSNNLELTNHQNRIYFYAADIINMSEACYFLYHIIYGLSDCLSYNSF